MLPTGDLIAASKMLQTARDNLLFARSTSDPDRRTAWIREARTDLEMALRLVEIDPPSSRTIER